MKYYGSPRWSGEICDCSMPMTFDTYNLCSYRCLYCFSFFQRSINTHAYLNDNVRWVNPEKVMRIFTDPDSSPFGPYVKQRLAMQWGGLSDQFDEHERERGITLGLLKFFRAIQYPISFSTKAAWWTEDERYVSLFRGADHFNLKFSIITLDEEKARKVEVLVPSPEERLKAMARAASWGIGGVTLRLRPFIIGVTTPSYLELIERAAGAGAEAVSTEFVCIEKRSKKARRRFEAIGRVAGYDLLKMYTKASKGQSGYLRGSREMKRPYIDAMQEKCDKLGLRFYVSDAHFKERCANGSCCGLRPDWNYSRGQFTEALVIAKEKGQVRWADIVPGLEYLGSVKEGVINIGNAPNSWSPYHGMGMVGWIHHQWNNVNGRRSPYKYFGGVLHPIGRDESGDVIYEYRGDI